MAEISKITLPSGNTYDIKDATAREMISGGVSFIVAWNGTTTPTVSAIPEGVVVTYNGTNYTGTLEPASAQASAFYLVKSSKSETLDVYNEYVVADIGGTKTWEKLGDTQADLSDVVTGVTLNKQTDVVLGEATTFALTSGTVTHGTPTTTAVSTGVTKTTKKLVTTSVPNVTSAGSASSWSFAMGSGANAETLIISGANGSAPTLGTAITVATGAVGTTGSGTVVTDVSSSGSADAITAMPTSSVGTGITVGTGDKITVLTNSTSITVSKDA